MSNRKTRDRQLRKLHERRIMQRRRQKRQRSLTMIIASVLVVALSVGLVFVLANRGKETSATSNPGATATPTAPTPTAATVACDAKVPKAASQKKATYEKPPKMAIDPAKTYTATVVTSCGTFVMELDPKQSPNAVNSFVFLAKHGFFDGLIFHRISKDFVIQGGDPTGTGTSGPGYSTVDTPPKDATYPLGTVAMAKAGTDPAGTAGSQFFVVTGPNGSSLTPDYAIIGKVVQGQDVAKKIEDLPIQGGATDGSPAETVYIESVRIKVS